MTSDLTVLPARRPEACVPLAGWSKHAAEAVVAMRAIRSLIPVPAARDFNGPSGCPAACGYGALG